MGKFKPKCRTCKGALENGSEFYCWLPSQCKKCRKKYLNKRKNKMKSGNCSASNSNVVQIIRKAKISPNIESFAMKFDYISEEDLDIRKLQNNIRKLNERVEYLESLHKCTCPTQEEQSKMINGKWHCSLHGTTIIHFQSPITRMVDKIRGHLAKP